MKLVIATHNLHKVRELKAMLKPLSFIDLFSLNDFPHYQLPNETGATFEENALLKAKHAATHLYPNNLENWILDRAKASGLNDRKQAHIGNMGLFPIVQPRELSLRSKTNFPSCLGIKEWVLADDSGLVVPILKGEPGIHSARYAGPQATDKENRAKLLHALKGKVGLQRAAYFACTLALVSPEGQAHFFNGKCEGEILTEERGRHGFGYDSLFLKNDYHLTFAEIDEMVKNRISHRRKAVDKLLLFLESHAFH